MTKVKIIVDSRNDYQDQKNKLSIAGGGMIVPTALRVDGESFTTIGTGKNEFRATRKSREETPENLTHYGVGEVEVSGNKLFVLSNDYIEKGEAGTLTVRKTVTKDAKGNNLEQWGAEYQVGVPVGRVN